MAEQHPVHCMTCRRAYRMTTVPGSTGLCAECLENRLARNYEDIAESDPHRLRADLDEVGGL